MNVHFWTQTSDIFYPFAAEMVHCGMFISSRAWPKNFQRQNSEKNMCSLLGAPHGEINTCVPATNAW